MQTVRIRRVTVAGVQNDLVLTVPLTSRIEGLQKLIYDELEVYPSEQKLYYGGKELIPDHLVTDYKIKNGDVIQLLVRHFTCNVEESESDDSTECANLTSTASNYYRTGDAIDVVYSELGAWFEAKVVKIFVDQSLERVGEEDLIFQVVMDRNERTAPINVKFNEIRPRARYIYETAELRAGMMVLVNYNIQKPRERGYWYDLTITRVDGDVVEGNLILGNNHEGVNNCVIQFADEVMKIEPARPLTDRVEATGDIPLRKLPLYCDKCKDVTSKNCKECSCNICGKKNCIDKLIICDECEYTYHLFCLNPPLLEVPSDPEWYCPDCKTDESEIVRAGEKLKRIEGKNWIKKCKDQMRNYILKNHFGPVFGIEVGTCWTSRPQLCEIHGTSSTDIHYNEYHGVYSIILNGNNESDVDNGEEFYYTLLDGRSGSDRQTITLQVSSQLPTRMIK
ncbi:hypothetical protein GEV33_007975 [Tenebrio molitor]|uniref:RING-type E3 ubiquitin transferase n=1 Tax=Tenebrio molitor TaxID=7067 RepID=A0A8J6HHE7_TENMO|nr:hypothetical protein GEV33_007975 [Tenebrio molitor]